MNKPSGKFKRLVFVYGTLKTGFCRNHWLDGYVMLGLTKTRPLYRMYDCGEYPGMIPASGHPGISIRGEVWAVDEIAIDRLDQVEGVAEGLYERMEIELVDPFQYPVEGYLYSKSVCGMADCGDNWTKGEMPLQD